jgi:hypothetical protein
MGGQHSPCDAIEISSGNAGGRLALHGMQRERHDAPDLA